MMKKNIEPFLQITIIAILVFFLLSGEKGLTSDYSQDGIYNPPTAEYDSVKC